MAYCLMLAGPNDVFYLNKIIAKVNMQDFDTAIESIELVMLKSQISSLYFTQALFLLELGFNGLHSICMTNIRDVINFVKISD